MATITENFDRELPAPYAFNSLKHHLGYVKQWVSQVVDLGNVGLIHQMANSVNGTLIDFYIGPLTPQQIAEEIGQNLKSKSIFLELSLMSKLKATAKRYLRVNISDGSRWVVTRGRFEGRYIHFHPARYSEHTVRVKATTLKTAIACSVIFNKRGQDISVSEINFVRETYLKLSPLKKGVLYHPIFSIVRYIHS